MADKYIRDLSVLTGQLAAQDKVIIEKADGSGTKIMGFSDLVASITANILKNNGTTTASGYALDARYGKTLNDSVMRGRGYLASSITEDSLISLPSGMYAYNTEYSWLPAGAAGYGTILSIQDNESGAAGYGMVILTDNTMKTWVRHHSSTAWHSSSLGWVSLNPEVCTVTAATNVTWSGYVNRIGNMVFVGGTLNGTGSVSAGSMLIGGLPASAVNNLMYQVRDNNTGNFVTIMVSSAGTITSQSALANGSSYRISLVYPVQQYS